MKKSVFTTTLLALLLMCGGVVMGQMVQQVVNLPEEYIYCCSHPTANILYLGGLHGVYKSTDNGETWDMVHEYDTTVHIPQSLEDTVVPLPFFYMNFKDASTGFASKTRNRKSFYSFDFMIVQDHPAIGKESPGLYRTTDGGVTWNVVDSSHFFANVQFAGPDIVYAYERHENTLYKSVDGGVNWERVFNGAAIDDYSAVDEDVVYVLQGSQYVEGYYGSQDPVLPTVYKSSDGGETWTLILNDETSTSKAPVKLDIIHFWEDGKGVVMGNKQLFTNNDFATYNIQGSGFTYVSYLASYIQSLYLKTGHTISTCSSINNTSMDDIKLRFSRDYGHHTSCLDLTSSFLGVTAITGCEEDTMFFVAVEDRLYRIDGSYFPPVGIEEYDDATGITVHPNPTNDILHITATDGEIARVEMMDMFGRITMVGTQNLASPPSPEYTVDLSSLPAGLYLLRVTLRDGTVRTEKVVKR
jgi:photosystem II stability/assembly factor-like uncharacterized protein